MRPFYFAFMLCIVFSVPSASRADAPDYDEVKSLIDAGDYVTLDARLAEAQRLFEAGEISGDDTRILYAPFGVVDPRLAEFVYTWAEAMPESPYAMVAQGWMYHRAAWVIRGERTMVRTSPDARYLFSNFLDEAFYLASTAYEMHPQMLPASDMLIYLSREGRAVQSFDSLIEEIMQRNPNSGTIIRGLRHYARGWGGTFELGQRLCARYGPMFEAKWGPHATEACELTLVNHYYLDRLDERHLAWLEEFGDENKILKSIRRGITLHKPLSQDAWVRDLGDWMAAGNNDNPAALWAFRIHHSTPEFHPDLYEKGMQRVRYKARAALEENPYHVAALQVLSPMRMPNFAFVAGLPDKAEMNAQKDLDAGGKLEIAWRLLEINPYESNHWTAYHRVVQQISPGHPLLSWIDRNIMGYQNYAPDMLIERVGELEFYIMNFQTQVGHAEQFKTESMMPDRNEMISVYCPAIAQLRLAMAQCKENMESYPCRGARDKGSMFKQWLRDAEKLDICRVERMVDVWELGVDPVPFDDETFIWPRTPDGLEALKTLSEAGRAGH